MLLNARVRNSATKGSLLSVTFVGGEMKVLKPPFKPFFYSQRAWPDAEVVKRRRLSDMSEIEVWRPEFDTDSLRKARSKVRGVWEGRADYLRRLAALTGFKVKSGDPALLSWDLESFTEGRLTPNPKLDILRSIAAWRDGEIKEFKSGSEPVVAGWFLDLVQDVDPDILIDYNGAFYDMPLLMAACRRHDIKCELGRDGSEPDIYTWDVKRRNRVYRKARVRINARIHFDAWKEVNQDQGLFDLKNRRLATVSKHFGLKPIEGVDHKAIPEGRLSDVNLDDARITFGVAQVYLPTLYDICELMDLPLSMVVERNPSMLAELIYMREFDDLGIVSDGINMERFPWAFSGEGKAYQGAEVRCFETGLFKPIKHKDYAGFYPNIMAAGNFSPETCRLLKVKPLTGKYRFRRKDDYAIYEVPDAYRGQVCVAVDLSADSVSRRKVTDFMDLREIAKAEYKRTKEKKHFSRSWALKIMANIMYGVHGMRYSQYGNLLVAILTTAMARYIIKHKMDEERAEGYRMIEVDTDGFWEVQEVQEVQENEVISV